MTKTLDLGCGSIPRNPFHADELFGVDVRSNLAGNIRRADLVTGPIPFEADYFDYLTAYDFIEHIPRLIYHPERRNPFVELMNEIHRVLKPGGLFFSHTPAYPHAVAFRDPTHVNIITEETFQQYFDDQLRWASIYGFKGAFRVRLQRWDGPHLDVVLQKVPSPDLPAPAFDHESSRISVVIPVHNGEKYVGRTLESVLAQTCLDFEALCVDDASTDGSASILNSFAERDSRVRVFKTPHNLGSASRSLNFALPHITGAYFAYSSQDDLFSNDWLEKMRARALETGADAVIPDVVLHHDDASISGQVISGLAGDRSAILSGREACRLSLDWSIPGNALWKADLVRKLGFEEFALNSDEYSVRRFFLQCDKVAFSEGKFLRRQDNPDAIAKRVNAGTFGWPLTQLRIAQLIRENGFEPRTVRREVEAASSAMEGLRARLEAEGAGWGESEVARAMAIMTRFEDQLRFEQGSAEPAKRKPWIIRRIARLKRSLGKLPSRLGFS